MTHNFFNTLKIYCRLLFKEFQWLVVCGCVVHKYKTIIYTFKNSLRKCWLNEIELLENLWSFWRLNVLRRKCNEVMKFLHSFYSLIFWLVDVNTIVYIATYSVLNFSLTKRALTLQSKEKRIGNPQHVCNLGNLWLAQFYIHKLEMVPLIVLGSFKLSFSPCRGSVGGLEGGQLIGHQCLFETLTCL